MGTKNAWNKVIITSSLYFAVLVPGKSPVLFGMGDALLRYVV